MCKIWIEEAWAGVVFVKMRRKSRFLESNHFQLWNIYSISWSWAFMAGLVSKSKGLVYQLIIIMKLIFQGSQGILLTDSISLQGYILNKGVLPSMKTGYIVLRLLDELINDLFFLL